MAEGGGEARAQPVLRVHHLLTSVVAAVNPQSLAAMLVA